jgi:predicted dehydrogenase
MSKTYKAIVAGAGSIGNAHMEGYKRVDEVDVVAVVDPIAPARQTYMDDYGVPRGYATLAEALEKEQPDIVSVCVWHLLHDTVTVEAAQWPSVQGIICEKPMAIGMARADRMVEACEANGVKLVISHQRRFTPGWEKAKELVEQGAIGEPLRADLRVKEGLANWGTHSIDGARFITGDPRAEWVMGAVERRTDKHERDTAIEDACMGLIHFGPSLQFFIQSDLWDRNCDAGKFLLRGTEGLLHVTETRIQLFNASTGGWTDVPLGLQEGDKAIGGNTNAAQTRELIEWIEGGPEHRGSGRKARDTVEIMMAMYESARQNKVIRLPLEEKEYPLDMMIKEGKLKVETPGRYDIRGFLKRDGIDEDRYRQLKQDGLGHHQVMRILHDEMKAAGKSKA